VFVKNEFDGRSDVNDLVNKIKQSKLDTYDILSKYSGYVQSSYNITALTLQQRVVTAKNFLEYFDRDKSKKVQAESKVTSYN
jgi:hypothetical protein